MKCDEIKGMYDDFKLQMLSNDESATINEHLVNCTDCNDYFAKNNKLSSLMDTWDEIEPQSNYVSKFWSRVEEVEKNENKGVIGFIKGIRTTFLVPSLAVALFCSLFIVNMYRTSTVNPTYSEQDLQDNRLLQEINDIISVEGSESLQIYGLWNNLEEESKEG